MSTKLCLLLESPSWASSNPRGPLQLYKAQRKVGEGEAFIVGNIETALKIVLIASLNNTHISFTYMADILKAFNKHLSWSHFMSWVNYTECLYWNRQILQEDFKKIRTRTEMYFSTLMSISGTGVTLRQETSTLQYVVLVMMKNQELSTCGSNSTVIMPPLRTACSHLF